MCLADYLHPQQDHLGCFVVQAGAGVKERVHAYKEAGDDYNAILLEALADRLAESCAEWLHHKVRTTLWGYAPKEDTSSDDLISEKYIGIRPAPGYPACPDHTEKSTLFEVLEASSRLGVSLTESMAMLPSAAVSGWYFAHPEAQYFGIGKIGADQLEDWAERKGLDVDEAARWLRPNLI